LLAGDLDGIDERERAGIVGDLDQFGNRESGPVGPREGAETGDVGPIDGRFVRVSVQPPGRGIDHTDLDARSLQALPRQRPRRVLQVRADHHVTRLEPEPVGHRVDTGGRALGQRYFLGFGPDEGGDAHPDVVEGIKRRPVGVRPDGRVVLVCREELPGGVDDVPGTGTVCAVVHVDAVRQRGDVRAEFDRGQRLGRLLVERGHCYRLRSQYVIVL
jgi:hypothetical protein